MKSWLLKLKYMHIRAKYSIGQVTIPEKETDKGLGL